MPAANRQQQRRQARRNGQARLTGDPAQPDAPSNGAPGQSIREAQQQHRHTQRAGRARPTGDLAHPTPATSSGDPGPSTRGAQQQHRHTRRDGQARPTGDLVHPTPARSNGTRIRSDEQQARPTGDLAQPTLALSNVAPGPPFRADVSCACCGRTDQDLIKACCCEGRWLHARCWRLQRIASWKKYRREARHMPVTELLDCPHCGSAYRFKYQSRMLRIAVEHIPSALWPFLFLSFYVVAFLVLCQIYCWLEEYLPHGMFFVLPDTPYKYLWGGVDMINALTTFMQVKGRGSLLYLAMFSRMQGDSLNTLTSTFGKVIFCAVIVHNLYNITRDIYMYGVWVTIQFATPLSFMEDSPSSPTGNTSSGHNQGSPPAAEPMHLVGGDAAHADDGTRLLTFEQLSELAQPLGSMSVASSSSLPESSVSQQQECPKASEEPTKEKVLAAPAPPALKVHSDCLCCLEKSAQFVAGSCGHLVACGQCRRRLVYKELCHLGVAGLPKMRDLGAEMVSDTEVTCPICRAKGTLVALQHFKGTVFHP